MKKKRKKLNYQQQQQQWTECKHMKKAAHSRMHVHIGRVQWIIYCIKLCGISHTIVYMHLIIWSQKFEIIWKTNTNWILPTPMQTHAHVHAHSNTCCICNSIVLLAKCVHHVYCTHGCTEKFNVQVRGKIWEENFMNEVNWYNGNVVCSC